MKCVLPILGLLSGFIFPAQQAAAQQSIAFYVKSREGSLLANANVRIHVCNMQQPLGFAISNAAGLVKLNVPPGKDSLCVTITHIQCAPKELTLAWLRHHDTVVLAPQVLEIQEVVVKPPPVTRRGDTLIFNVSAYDQPDFNSIGDVIKNLPGVEVAPSGAVMYNGREIAAYYIEGLDLLGNRYRLANERLPKGMVGQVQIILHHQPIRMLDTLVKTNDVAINLQLKNASRGKLIHQLETRGGAGVTEALADLNLQQVFISKQFQLLANINANNIGIDNVAIMNGIATKDYTELPIDFNKVKLVNAAMPASPPLPVTSFHFNRSLYPSLNLVKKLAPHTDFKWNINFVTQEIRQWQQQETRYRFADSTITIAENNRMRQRDQVLQTGIQLLHNSKTSYHITDIRFTGFFDQSLSVINSGTLPNLQMVQLPEWDLAARNRFMKTKGRSIWGAGVLTRLKQTDQLLLVEPPPFAQVFFPADIVTQLRQPLYMQQWRNKGFFNISHALGKSRLNTKLELEHLREHFRRRIEGVSGLHDTPVPSVFPEAGLRNEEWHFRLLPTWSRQQSTFGYTLRLPITWIHINQQEAAVRTSWQQVLLNASFSFFYKLSNFKTFTVDAARRNETGSFFQRMNLGFLPQYRSFETGNSSVLPVTTENEIALGLNEDDASRPFLWNLRYRFSNVHYNTIGDVLFEAQLQKSLLVPLRHVEYRHVFVAGGTYNLMKHRTYLRLHINARLSGFNQLQEQALRSFNVHSYHANAGIETRVVKNTIQELTYNAGVNLAGARGEALRLAGVQHDIKFQNSVFLHKNKWSIHSTHQLLVVSGLQQRSTLGQHHATLGYNWNKNRLELGLQNISNERYFYQFFAFANVQTFNRFELRPFQALLRYRWKL